MTWLRRRTLMIPLGMLLVAAMLGSSLGIIAVQALRTENLVQGTNYEGPLYRAGDPLLSPAQFVSCLPAASWGAVYYYDTPNTRWLHHFPEGTGAGQVPAFVNTVAAGGFTEIPRGSAVAIIMNTAVANAKLKDRPADLCN